MADRYRLIDVDDSVLVVIDVQDSFLEKLPDEVSGRLLSNICWLVDLAGWCGVPLVVTAEEGDEYPVVSDLSERLPEGTTVFNKLVFGLADQADILEAVGASGRKTAVLVGLETDVCVAHSALGLLAHGYRVVVVGDCVGTPEPNQTMGLNRMVQAGVVVTNMKGLFYEWLRTVEQVGAFHQALPDMRARAGAVL